MQLAIDGLIALVVVVSHLVILARMAYLDVFTYRYIPYVIVVTAVKWLAKVLWQIDIPDAIYLLVFIFIEKPQALREEKYFYAFFSPLHHRRKNFQKFAADTARFSPVSRNIRKHIPLRRARDLRAFDKHPRFVMQVHASIIKIARTADKIFPVDDGSRRAKRS